MIDIRPTDDELAEALRDLGPRLDVPPSPELAMRVRARLEARPRSRAWVYAAAALAVLLAGLALGQSVAISHWLGVRGIRIVLDQGAHAPVVADLRLGRLVSLAEVRRAVPFRVLIPAALGDPDQIYVSEERRVSLVYKARPGLPRAHETGVGLLVTEFRAELDPSYLKKLASGSTRIEAVTFGGGQGYWISGAHTLVYRSPAGVREDVLRLAGSVLIWERDGVTFRFESALSKEGSLRIAKSMR
ncbi:MAG: hypothetical protein ACRDIC_04455 [bacterium]